MSYRPSGSPEPADETRSRVATRTSSENVPPSPATPGGFTLRRNGQAEGKPEDKDKGVLAFLRELPVLIVLAFALAIVLKSFVVQAFYIPSGSMEPTLKPGDRVLVNKIDYHPARGEIIVFQDPHPGAEPDRGIIGGFFHWFSEGLGFARPVDEDFIKRIVGMPGETIEIHDHKVFVNGAHLHEPYLTKAAKLSMGDYGPVRVPKDALFVMGDNRGNSNDSRASLGFIPLDKVIGRAFVTIWPASRIGWLH